MSPLTVGDVAPDFSLVPAPAPQRVTLSEHRGGIVVLLFVPLAFSGTCTAEFCQVRDDWARWQELDARVLGISGDSPFVVKKWAEELRVPFTVLSDFNREAGEAYGVLYEDFFGLRGVAKRSVFVVDGEGVIRYAWVEDDADVIPPFDEVMEAVRAAG